MKFDSKLILLPIESARKDGSGDRALGARSRRPFRSLSLYRLHALQTEFASLTAARAPESAYFLHPSAVSSASGAYHFPPSDD